MYNTHWQHHTTLHVQHSLTTYHTTLYVQHSLTTQHTALYVQHITQLCMYNTHWQHNTQLYVQHWQHNTQLYVQHSVTTQHTTLCSTLTDNTQLYVQHSLTTHQKLHYRELLGMLYPCIYYLHCCINSHYSYDETFHGIYGQEIHAAAASGWQRVQQVTGERRAYLDQGKDVLQVVLDVMLDNGDDDTQLLKEELKHTHSHGSQCTATGPSRWAHDWQAATSLLPWDYSRIPPQHPT